MSSKHKVYCILTQISQKPNIFKQTRAVYLKLWIEGEEEGLSGAVKAIADFKRLRCQRPKHLEKQNTRATDYCIQQHL